MSDHPSQYHEDYMKPYGHSYKPLPPHTKRKTMKQQFIGTLLTTLMQTILQVVLLLLCNFLHANNTAVLIAFILFAGNFLAMILLLRVFDR